MRKLLNRIVNRIKGEEFIIDKQIPSGYLMNTFLKRFLMLIRGYIKFGRFNRICFIGPRVRIRCRKSLSFVNGLTINEGCYIDCLSSEGLKFGKNVNIGARTMIEGTGSLKMVGKGLLTGDNVSVGPCCHIGCAGGVIIGSDTVMGNYVTIHPENHKFDDNSKPIRFQGVEHTGIRIGRNCWIGAKAMILDGADIADGCVIAGGSVVLNGKYESDSVYGGNPAKFLKRRLISAR
jgi:Acetyltransferase (isoleucine patch superfamily)